MPFALRSRPVLAGAAGLALACSLTACGGSGSATTTDDVAAPTGAPAGEMPDFPGASGEVAAVDGRTAQVQSETSGQVAVTWTGETQFTRTVVVDLADVEAGDCVVVSGDGDEATMTAMSVQVSESGEEGCSTGMPSMDASGQDAPDGAPSPPEGDAPQGAPDGGTPPARVAGEVASIDGDTLVVAGESAETTVSVTDGTTLTGERDADAGDVAIGLCLMATGETDDVGAVTAARVTVSEPVDGSCGGPGARP